ncbi:3 -5 exonuclease domain containing protein, putative [Babesia ovata]|uniref:3-5 exonuclease domain containing protein, putative n=1 Tax=Babesia ovata TaxID=189622 RepID=A0A2H6KB82_9APIC|nr:3 -5 exonuclease domain containing protein, putative [Babesia ovata]GBE60247.1 3 -5 exonuclease domain containing protein, putative [Babesia ovata]
MVEVLPQLCAIGDRHTLVANVVFHFVGSSNVPSERMSRYFKHGYLQALNYVYSDRSFKEPPLAFSSVQHAREIIFSPLNRRLVREVSPAMRPQPLEDLAGNVEAALYRFAMYNTRAKEYVCVNGLFRAVGAREFSRTVRLLRLHHKLLDTLEASTINEYFVDTFADASEIAQLEAVDMALTLLQQQGHPDLYAPFVAGSWRAADVLQQVVESESKTALEQFFASAPQSTISQACDMLRSTDIKTGLLRFPWGYVESQNLIMRRNEDTAAITGKTLEDGNDVKLEDNDEEIEEFREYTNLPHTVDTVADVIHMLKSLKRYAQQHAETRDGLVSVHIERDAVAFATPRSTFIVDLLVSDPLYQSTLFQLLAWLWSNSGLVKIGHNLLPKVAKLASQFDRPFTAYVNMVDLRNQRSSTGPQIGDEAVTRFKPSGDPIRRLFNVYAGISRTLKGLLQEYNIAVPHFDRQWSAEQRPICPSRARYMEQMATSMLSIEEQLRDDGWMPTDFCDLSSYDNGKLVAGGIFKHEIERACEELEQRIENALL